MGKYSEISDVQLQNYVDRIYEASSLKDVMRAHKQTLVGTNSGDTIAAHSHLVAIIAWILAEMAHISPYKVCCMGVFHDFDEARSGDQNWLHKRYVVVDSDLIHKEQYAGFSPTSVLPQLMEEYSKRQTKAAKLAKDADLLAQVVLLREYASKGNKEAERQLGGRKKEGAHLSTKEAKKLNTILYSRGISDWWIPLSQKERRSE